MKKNQNASSPCNDTSTDVQYIYTINRSSGLQYSSESYGGKYRHVENDGHSNKHTLFRRILFEKNQNAPRPLMILLQMYNMFRLLIGVPDYSI